MSDLSLNDSANNLQTPRLVLRSHENRLRDHWEPPDFSIDGLLAVGGVGAIVAMPGCGKTLLGINLAGCVAEGTAFLGRSVKTGRVVYACPDSPASTERRMLALSDRAAKSVFTVTDMGGLSTAVALLRLDIAEAATLGDPVQLLVIDTWDSARSHSGGGYAEQDGLIEEAMRELRRLASDCKLSVILIHHATRNDNGRARGSLVFDARCDWIALAKGDGKSVSLSSIKCRDGEKTDVGSFTIGTVAINGRDVPVLTNPTPAWDPTKVPNGIEQREWDILAVLDKQTSKMGKQALADTVGVPVGSMARIVERMRGRSWIDLANYVITDAGRLALIEHRGIAA